MHIAISAKNKPYSNFFYWSVLALFAFLIVRYQILLLDYFEWGDESETIVTAKMMAAGQKLYSEIFNMHGPAIFIPGYILEKFASFGIAGHRVFIAFLQWCALVAIYRSPLLNSGLIRLVAIVIAATVMVAYLPDFFGHNYLYQVVAGLLIAIALSQYCFVSIAQTSHLSVSRVVLGNFLIVTLPFLAITYIPISACLFFAAFQKRYFKPIVYSTIAALLVNLGFLGLLGSFPGFFAIHVYLNLKIAPAYAGGDLSAVQLAYNFARTLIDSPMHLGLFIILIIGVSRLALLERPQLPWRSALLGLGIVSLLIRGFGFQGLPYMYAVLSFICVLLSFSWRNLPRWVNVSLVGILLICTLKLTLIFKEDQNKLISKQIPKTTEFAQLAQRLTDPSDRIIAYTFQNHQYILANRLPAVGNYFYFPWQANYYSHPILGIETNICQDIDQARPKLMLIDKMFVNSEWRWESYAGCIDQILDQHYTQLLGKHYYVRNDLFAADMQAEPKLTTQSATQSPTKQ